jgi:hypothetical protein
MLAVGSGSLQEALFKGGRSGLEGSMFEGPSQREWGQ